MLSQMGSHMKKAIFEEQTAKALQKWRDAAREKRKKRTGLDTPSGYTSGENTPTRGSSPIHLLHKYKTNSADVESVSNSPPRLYQSDNDADDFEAPTFKWQGEYEPRRPNSRTKYSEFVNGDFTFGSN